MPFFADFFGLDWTECGFYMMVTSVLTTVMLILEQFLGIFLLVKDASQVGLVYIFGRFLDPAFFELFMLGILGSVFPTAYDIKSTVIRQAYADITDAAEEHHHVFTTVYEEATTKLIEGEDLSSYSLEEIHDHGARSCADALHDELGYIEQARWCSCSDDSWGVILREMRGIVLRALVVPELYPAVDDEVLDCMEDVGYLAPLVKFVAMKLVKKEVSNMVTKRLECLRKKLEYKVSCRLES